jgi:hypothetical protein
MTSFFVTPRGSRLATRKSILLAAACIFAGNAWAQADIDHPEQYFRTAPYPPFSTAPPPDYNLKWGRLSARVSGSVSTEYNDNINLADHDALDDFIFEPNVGIGFILPLSEINILQFDLGLGYRVYVNNPELNSFQITPDSQLVYHLRAGKTEITVHDKFSIQVDPLSRPELSGTNNAVLDYKRFINDIGFETSYEVVKDLTLVGSYDFLTDRSISGSFKELDRNDHLFTLAAFRPLNSKVTVGLGSSYTMMEYVEPIQNDGTIFSVGPRVMVKATDFISLDGGVNYTLSDYQQTGTIGDASNFEGVTASGQIRHILNSKTHHYLRYVKSLNPGIGSNFTDDQQVQYGLGLRASSSVTLDTSFSYEAFDVSGANAESGTRNIWYIGSTFHISKTWDAGLAYSFSWKNSDQPNRDYTQNRVMVRLTRNF